MRKPSARAVATADRIQAILEEAGGFPLSTMQVCERMGPFTEARRANNCPNCKHVEEWTSVYPALAWRHEAYPALLRLEKRGIVVKERVTGFRAVYWRASMAEVIEPSNGGPAT